MPTISNVNLKIQHGGSGNSRAVTVTYTVCFSACEALAGSTFTENVLLRGSDPIWDDNLVTISNKCIKAQDGCINRTITANVSRNTLDEDPDTIITLFGWEVAKIADQDEIYAQITLTPYSSSGASANSNIVTGQFGAAGND